LPVSALEENGLQKAWEDMTTLAAWRRENGHFEARRAAQARHWFETEVREGLLARLSSDPAIRARMTELGDAVASGNAAPAAAAQEMLARLGA
ncbi:MAG: methylmalonyl Co-A mutase-associated GTPase MeaB, partial [Paracoccaceae bacterium]